MATYSIEPVDSGADSTAGYQPTPQEYYSATGRIPVGRPPKLNWAAMDQAQRHEYIANFWEQQGVPRAAAQGIADALHGESGFGLTATNPRSGAIGLAQDLGTRKTELLSQPDWSDPDVQLNNMLREVHGGDKIAAQHWDEIKGAKSREQGRQLWSKYFERPGIEYASGWNVAAGAIGSEQNRSNTDVKYMTPEEYLALLPPIQWDEATRAKRKNLLDSLAAGDSIEQIPSLDVSPRGDSLHVADWDGRNRAQAAIDAGVDEIPVSIRGVPKGTGDQFKLLVGNKKVSLPYTFLDVPKREPPVRPIVAPEQIARQTVPQAFVPGPSARFVPPPQAPMVAPIQPAPAKPDFYPQIAAGINNDIINPAGIGYRGTGVPDLATNATAGGRIAAANAGSAGRIGLGGAIGSALAAINPIGSAQAAEAPSSGLNRYTVEPVEPGLAIEPSGYSVGGAAPKAPPASLLDYTGLNTVAPPLANFLAAPLTAAAGDVYAAFQHPQSMADWAQKAQAAQTRLQVPETPMGQNISNVLNAPGVLLGWAIGEVVGQDRLARAAPYIKPALDAAGLLSVAPSVNNVLATPGRAALGRMLQTPEMRAVRAVNRVQPEQELSGGMPVAEQANRLAQAQRLGIPLAPIHLAEAGSPQDVLFRRALEYSPAAAGETKRALEEASFGPPTPAETRLPTGGILARMELAAGRDLGFGSAHDLKAGIDAELNSNAADLADAAQRWRELAEEIDRRDGFNDPALDALRAEQHEVTQHIHAIDRNVKRLSANKRGLDLGTDVLNKNVRRERVRDFLRDNPAEAGAHLRIGVQDILSRHYRSAKPGEEAYKIAERRDIQDKLVEAAGGAKRAADLVEGAKAEALLNRRNKNILRSIRQNTRMAEADKRLLARAVEAVAHFSMGLTHGGRMFSPIYWGLRAGRQFAERAITGGGHAARTRGEEIARLMRDPNTQLATGGPGLFPMPARPTTIPVMRRTGSVFGPINYGPQMVGSAASQESINALARGTPWLGYSMISPRAPAPEQQ